MNKNNLWRLSASEIAKATTAGEIRTVDVITSAVDRMKQVNPSLNAVVVDLSEKAIETADGQTIKMKSIGVDESGEQVSTYEFEWSVKLRK